MSKIITVWSPVSSSGVTTTAMLLSNLLSKKNKTCLLDLDLNNPDISLYLNINDVEHNIDNLFPFIEGDNLTEEIFESNLNQINNLAIMQGTRKLDKGPVFKTENLEPIIDMAEKLFDFCVVNVNSAIDNAGTYLALKKADKILVVLNQNILHFKKYIRYIAEIQTITTLEPLVVINKYDRHLDLNLNNIKNSLNLEIYPLSLVDPKYVISRINNQVSFLNIFTSRKAKRYQKDLEKIKSMVKEG